MIKRYTRPEMGRIWTDENEFQTMLDIEIYACEIMAENQVGPASYTDMRALLYSYIRCSTPNAYS